MDAKHQRPINTSGGKLTLERIAQAPDEGFNFSIG
jgi:hypothetical protein